MKALRAKLLAAVAVAALAWVSLPAQVDVDPIARYIDSNGVTSGCISVSSAAGVSLCGDGDGTITLLGLGDGADEALSLNLDDTANAIVASSSTGAIQLTWTEILQAVTRAALATTSTDGAVLQNTTASTAGVPVQQSPRLRLRSNVWNTTVTAANNTNDWFIESVPVSAATPSGLLKVGSSLNEAAATYPMTLTSAGNLTIDGLAYDLTFLGGTNGVFTVRQLNSETNIQAAAAGLIYWNGRTEITSSADGLLNVKDAAQAVGLQLNTGTAAPTLTTCGTGSVTTGSRNAAGEGTATGATVCTVTDLTGARALWISTGPSTTAFTISGLTASDKFSWICLGRI